MSIKVIYICGVGRSGSTVLDIALGEHPDVISTGELTNLVKFAWINNEYCACGRPAGECPFWAAVRQAWADRLGSVDAHSYCQNQASFERIRHIPGLLLGRRKRAGYGHYLDRTAALFESISGVAGSLAIVDSSKNPLRALSIAQIPAIDLRLVHLVRDPRGVAWSFQKALDKDLAAGVQHDLPPRPLSKTAFSWSLGNALALIARRQLPPEHSLLVRYEDFVTDPVRVLQRIGGVVDLDLSTVAERIAEGRPLSPNHTVAGNRVRMTGAIRLNPDMEWKERLPRRDRLLVEALTAPMRWWLAGSS